MAEMFEAEELNFDQKKYIAQWVPEVAQDWAERYSPETFGKLGTALYMVARNKQAQAAAKASHEAFE